MRRRSPAGRARRAVCAALVALVALVSTAAPAVAVTVGDYQKWRLIDRTWRVTPTGVLEIRLLGIFQGLSLANRLIERRGGRPFFCPTGTAALTGRTLREWIDDELQSPSRRHGKPYPPRTAIEAVVLAVAMHKFPCKNTAPAK